MPSPLSRHWNLDPEITFLNHGSFGACPAAILETQQKLRARLEANPVRFFMRELDGLLEASRGALARLVHADPDDIVFLSNATAGVNAVARSLRFSPGDEILVTDHTYNACRNVVDYVAGREGARLVVAHVPFPIVTPSQVTEAILGAVTPRTRLAVIDHITSPTALIFPIREIVAALAERGIDTLVDGAHAPGMVSLDIEEIGAAYYTGNCHKWLCAPKGAAFLHARRDRQETIQPTSVSHGYNTPVGTLSPFQRGFQWTGTADPTAFLCVGASIEWCKALMPGGMEGLRRHNHELVARAREILCAAWGTSPLCPPEMLGSMATIALPPLDLDAYPLPTGNDIDLIQDILFEKHQIEVPLMPWSPESPSRFLRVSAQAYNCFDDYQRLAEAYQLFRDEATS